MNLAGGDLFVCPYVFRGLGHVLQLRWIPSPLLHMFLLVYSYLFCSTLVLLISFGFTTKNQCNPSIHFNLQFWSVCCSRDANLIHSWRTAAILWIPLSCHLRPSLCFHHVSTYPGVEPEVPSGCSYLGPVWSGCLPYSMCWNIVGALVRLVHAMIMVSCHLEEFWQ